MEINEKKFREIYDRYFESVCIFLNYYTHDLQTIEDIVQEVFIKLWDDRHLREINYLKTYIFNSARNRMLNYLRDNQTYKITLTRWAETELERSNGNDCIDRDKFLFHLHEAIENLPEKCKEIFIASREDGLSYKQIAEKFHVSPKTVENQMGIALKKIRIHILSHSTYSVNILHFLL